jgi:hypothetical protein
MKKDIYDTLTAKEKLMYDELSEFAVRLSDRQEEIIELLKTIIAEANATY